LKITKLTILISTIFFINVNLFSQSQPEKKVGGAEIVITTNYDNVFIAIIDKHSKTIIKSGYINKKAHLPGIIKYGTYIVAGRLKDYGILFQEVLLSEGVQVLVNLEFTGSLEITGSPAGAKVYRDGEQIGKVPLLIDNHKIGTYTFSVEARGYKPDKKTLQINLREKNAINVQLVPLAASDAYKKSIIFPGLGQWYSGRKKTAGALALAELGAAAGIIYFNMRYNDINNDYQTALNNYKNALVDVDQKREIALRKHNDLTKARDYSNYAIYAAAGIWLYNIIDSLIFSSGVKDKSLSNITDSFIFSSGIKNNPLSASRKDLKLNFAGDGWMLSYNFSF